MFGASFTVRLRFLLLLFAFFVACRVSAEESPAKRPNILLIVTDDQRFDDLDGLMPEVEQRIFDSGVRFQRAYVTTPACCPSRSSILTGQYVSEHGVSGNAFVLDKPTFVEDLQDAGYETALVGKYLNSWSGEAREEFDFWGSFAAGSISYFDPVLHINGKWQRYSGYITDIFRDLAVEFLESRDDSSPFFLMLTFNAPHAPFRPAPEDAQKFSDRPIKPRPNFNEQDRSDKPFVVKKVPSLSKGRRRLLAHVRRKQWRCLASVDRAVARILDLLESQGALENTLIIFLSDNGLLNGEHALSNKDRVYEEAIRVPFAIRFADNFSPKESEALVANIDLAPTILDFAGIETSHKMSGKSLRPVLEGEQDDVRTDLLLESFRSGAARQAWAAVHTGRFVFVSNRHRGPGRDPNRFELYDLKYDPYQMRNLNRSRLYREVKGKLYTRLRELLLEHRGTTLFQRPPAEKLKVRPEAPLRLLQEQ